MLFPSLILKTKSHWYPSDILTRLRDLINFDKPKIFTVQGNRQQNQEVCHEPDNEFEFRGIPAFVNLKKKVLKASLPNPW